METWRRVVVVKEGVVPLACFCSSTCHRVNERGLFFSRCNSTLSVMECLECGKLDLCSRNFAC